MTLKIPGTLFTAAVALFLTGTNTSVHAGEIESASRDIQGMDCATCPLTVKAVLKKVPEVREVSVDYRTHSAEIKFDRDKTAPAQLAKAVTDIRYPATVKK